MEQLRIAIATAILYQDAEEEAAERRRQILQRKARMQRRMAKRRAILACLSSFVRFSNYSFFINCPYTYVDLVRYIQMKSNNKNVSYRHLINRLHKVLTHRKLCELLQGCHETTLDCSVYQIN